jgi:hypothetical protein
MGGTTLRRVKCSSAIRCQRACTSVYGGRNLFRQDPPLRRGDGEEAPFAGYALELVSAAVVELEP